MSGSTKCPKCGKETLQSSYVRQELRPEKGTRKRTFKAAGLLCVNPACDYCVKSKPENTGPEE